jgi:nitrite reductase/ring-hydroxylating ferredoxin subunit
VGGPPSAFGEVPRYDRPVITDRPTPPIPAAYPAELLAPGSAAPEAVAIDGGSLADLPEGSMRRVTQGDLDVLVAHTPAGLLAVDDRCPHMSAPLSIGELDGCVVACPLHEGRFDLCSGENVQMPTTGGLHADGTYVPTWSAAGKEPKVDPPGKKAEARRLTRVRRLRYYPLRIVEGRIEVTVPGDAGGAGAPKRIAP